MGKRLDSKIVLIIGGTSGIGKALAVGFVAEGAHVIPTSRTSEKVNTTIKQLLQQGNTWKESTTTDITSQEQIKEICDQIISVYGRLDVLACVAGMHLKKPAEQVSDEEWKMIIDTNLTGTFSANRIAGNIMLKQGSGSIINIGSLGSSVALSQTVAYCVSKAGVSMLTQCLSSEWCGRGVRVNTIIPGVFPTDLNKKALNDPKRVSNILRRTPMGRMGTVNELVGAAVFLASDEASFVSGISLPVDGGFLASSGF